MGDRLLLPHGGAAHKPESKQGLCLDCGFAYLRTGHRDHPEKGCAVAALAAELAR